MCGRYTLAHTTAELLKRFEADGQAEDIAASYNIAPTHVVPIILSCADSSKGRVLQSVRWGLIFNWVKELKKSKPLINARSESLLEKPSFKNCFQRKRCIIPADGFYEWLTVDGKKIPMHIKMKSGELFGFAGIYDDWRDAEGKVLRSCSIITVPANEMMSGIHHRMPAILTREAEKIWLDAQPPVQALHDVLVPFSNESLEAYAVSARVNSPSVNSPECIQALATS